MRAVARCARCAGIRSAGDGGLRYSINDKKREAPGSFPFFVTVYDKLFRKSGRRYCIHDKGSWVFGNREFIVKALSAEEAGRMRIARHAREGLDIEDVVSSVAGEAGLSARDLMHRGRKDTRAQARKTVAYKPKRLYGVPVIRIAEYFGISSAAVSVMVREGEKWCGAGE